MFAVAMLAKSGLSMYWMLITHVDNCTPAGIIKVLAEGDVVLHGIIDDPGLLRDVRQVATQRNTARRALHFPEQGRHQGAAQS